MKTYMEDKSLAMTAAEQIVELIDSKTLLGAAYDCMSPTAQEKFKRDVADIIEGVQSR